METRRLRQFTWTCQNGHSYLRPHLGDFADGEFLVESPDGTYAEANSYAGTTWDEVTALLDELPGYAALGWHEKGSIAQRVYGRTIDPHESGPFVFKPTQCPICGAEYRSVADIEPPIWIDDVPYTTHERWLALPIEAKRAMVHSAVDELPIPRDIARH